MKTTYILLENSQVMAFEGPVKPEQSGDAYTTDKRLERWDHEMFESKASRLPAVNADQHEVRKAIQTACGISHGEGSEQEVENAQMFIKHAVKPGEVVPLPGWNLEKVTMGNAYFSHQAYRLIRSEPVKVDSVQWQDIMTTAAGIEPEESPIEAKTQEPKFYRYTDCPGKDCNDGFIGNTLRFCPVCDGSGGVLPRVEIKSMMPESHKTQAVFEVWSCGEWIKMRESQYESAINNNHYGRINGALQHGDPERRSPNTDTQESQESIWRDVMIMFDDRTPYIEELMRNFKIKRNHE